MEVEIKLHVLPEIEGGPAAFFERLIGADSLAGLPLGKAEHIDLRDVYFDTSTRTLAHAGAGLRLRIENGVAFVTLKHSRRQEGALMVRDEYEYPLDATHLEQVLAHIRPLIGSQPVALADFASGRQAGPLLPVLDVVTHRVARQMGELATLTLDLVEYPGITTAIYFDIEVEAREARSGEGVLRAAEAALGLLAGGNLRPADLSKLARGLQLVETLR